MDNAPAGQINTEFTKLMKGMKKRMKDEDLSGVVVPMVDEEEVSVDEL